MTESPWGIAEIVVRPVHGDVEAALVAVRGALADYRVVGATVPGAREGSPEAVVARVLIDPHLRLATDEDGALVPGAEWFQVGQHLALRVPARVSFDGQVVIHPDGRIDDAPTAQDVAQVTGDVTDRTIVACRSLDEIADALFASSIDGTRSLVVNGWLLVEVSGRRSRAFSAADLHHERRPMFVMHAAGDHREVAVTRTGRDRIESWRVICPVPAEAVDDRHDTAVLSPPVIVEFETADSGPDDPTASAFDYATRTPDTLLDFAAGHLRCPDLVARWAVDPDADAGEARPVRRPERREIVKDAYAGELPGKGPWARMRRFFRRHPWWWLAFGLAELAIAVVMLLPGVVDGTGLRWVLAGVWALDGVTNTLAAVATLRERASSP